MAQFHTSAWQYLHRHAPFLRRMEIFFLVVFFKEIVMSFSDTVSFSGASLKLSLSSHIYRCSLGSFYGGLLQVLSYLLAHHVIVVHLLEQGAWNISQCILDEVTQTMDTYDTSDWINILSMYFHIRLADKGSKSDVILGR